MLRSDTLTLSVPEQEVRLLSPNKCIRAVLAGAVIITAVLSFTSAMQSQSVNSGQAKTPNYNADDYVGSDTCKDCHEKQFKDFSPTVHAKLTAARSWKDRDTGCETCHGPGKAHIAEAIQQRSETPGR